MNLSEYNVKQKIQFQRIAASGSWNNFDGDKIVQKLIEIKNSWISFVFGSFGYCDLIELRDMKDESGHIGDTIMLLCNKSEFKKIEAFAQECNANEIGYIYYDYNRHCFETHGTFGSNYKNFHQSFGSVIPENQVVVRIWWD